MAWILPDEASSATARLRDSLADDGAVVPSLWPVEVGNAILSATRRRRIRAEEWPALCAFLDALPIEIEAVAPSRAWGRTLDLARGRGLSSYDATYLELAARLRLPLATLDSALAAAARAEGVEARGGGAP